MPIARVTKWSMSAIVIVLGVMAFGACANQDPTEPDNLGVSSQAVTTNRYVYNGRSANAYAGEGTRGLSVSVWEDGTGSDRRTFGSIFTYEADPSSLACEVYEGESYCYYTRHTYVSGWGELPERDVLIRNDIARVQTTVANGPTFSIERCTIDYVAQTYECAAGDGGVLDVVWRKNGLYESSSAGMNSNKYGVYTSRSHGTSNSASADANGTLFGISFGGSGEPRGDGYLGSGRNMTIEIIKDTTGLGPK
jgi:hypothetical protein